MGFHRSAIGTSKTPPPNSPLKSESPPEELTFIPYGSAKLRVTEMPILSR